MPLTLCACTPPKSPRYYNWLAHGRAYPAPLWDARALVPKANFLWGSGAQLCGVLNATDDIALVGNGPISAEDREAISKHGRVVRFNALNNRCRWLLPRLLGGSRMPVACM